jgi:hypothetical protein
MSAIYRVEQPEGTVVWTDTTDDYVGYHHYPAEFTDNTLVSSTTYVYLDDVLISVVPPYTPGA